MPETFRLLEVGDENEFLIIPKLIQKYENRKFDAAATLRGLEAMYLDERANECRNEVKRCTEYLDLLRTQAAGSLLCQATFQQLAQPDNKNPEDIRTDCMMCPNCKGGYCIDWYEKAKDHTCIRCGSTDAMEQRAPGPPAHADNKITKLSEIIKGLGPDKPRVMVFAKYTQAFGELRRQLAGTELVIKEADAGTANAAETMLADFKSGKIDVLLAESSLFCSGMNLPEVTDVCFLHVVHAFSDMQISGRAQRPGRKAPCRIWTFLHDNETSAYQG